MDNVDSPSYAAGPASTPLLTDTIAQNFLKTAARFAEREALVDRASDRRWTYAQLAADVDIVAAGLLQLGLAKGDRVGIWAPNCAGWTLVQYATARIGVILVNINPAYRSHELAYVLQQSGIRTLVAYPEFKGASYADMIESVRDECPDLVDVVLVGEPSWTALLDSGRGGTPPRWMRLPSPS
jgi:fatty-acyl-CoA synthase